MILDKPSVRILCMALVSSALLAGCGGPKKTSFSKRGMDEYAVVTNPVLQIPPNFDLRAPVPNAPKASKTYNPFYEGTGISPPASEMTDEKPLSEADSILMERMGTLPGEETVENENGGFVSRNPQLIQRLILWGDVLAPASAAKPVREELKKEKSETSEKDAPIILQQPEQEQKTPEKTGDVKSLFLEN